MVYPWPAPSVLPVPSCSKCLVEFPEQKDGSSSFHAHLLVCGGVTEWDPETTKKKKSKRRWRGGGLKRTIRMIQKSASNEGTDTDGESPRKRARPTPRVLEPVPLVPTHTRTTRFKESMKKEARKEKQKDAAKRRRSEGKELKSAGVKRKVSQEGSSRSPSTVRRKIKLQKEADTPVVIKVLNSSVGKSQGEKKNGKSRSSSSSRSSESSIVSTNRKRRITKHKPGKLLKDSIRRASALRPRQINIYKEASSESESDSRSSIEDPVDPMQMTEENPLKKVDPAINILQTVAVIIGQVIEQGSLTPKKNVKRYTATPPIQTPTKAVPVKIEDDLKLVIVNDLDKMSPVRPVMDKESITEAGVEKSTPIPMPKGFNKKQNKDKNTTPISSPCKGEGRLYLPESLDLISKSTNVDPNSPSIVKIKSSKDDKLPKECVSKSKIPAFSPTREPSNKQSDPFKSEENGEATSLLESDKKGNRSLKRLESDLVEVNDLSPSGKRRNSFEVAKKKKPQPLRINLPLEVKIAAIERVETGESLAVVARDLDISITSLSAWLMRKGDIRNKQLVEQAAEAGQDIATKSDSDDEVLVNQLLESSGSEAESLANPNLHCISDVSLNIADALGLVVVSKNEKLPDPEEEVMTDSPHQSSAELTTTRVADSDQHDQSSQIEQNQNLANDIATSQAHSGVEHIEDKTEPREVQNLPLKNLFKSMKTAFSLKSPSKDLVLNGDQKHKSKLPVKKKSMEFLANALMEKAVAKSQKTVEEATCTLPSRQPPAMFAKSPSSPNGLLNSNQTGGKNHTGLALIGANYCTSSDDEL